jgi:hypothetical protein
MYHCAYCFALSKHSLPLCTTCGHSASLVRVCAQGHVNPVTVLRCTTCNEVSLSLPAPLRSRLDRVLYRLVRILFVLLTAASLFLSAFLLTGDITPTRAVTHLIAVVIMVMVLYRASLVLPGRVTRRAFPPFTNTRP